MAPMRGDVLPARTAQAKKHSSGIESAIQVRHCHHTTSLCVRVNTLTPPPCVRNVRDARIRTWCGLWPRRRCARIGHMHSAGVGDIGAVSAAHSTQTAGEISFRFSRTVSIALAWRRLYVPQEDRTKERKLCYACKITYLSIYSCQRRARSSACGASSKLCGGPG